MLHEWLVERPVRVLFLVVVIALYPSVRWPIWMRMLERTQYTDAQFVGACAFSMSASFAFFVVSIPFIGNWACVPASASALYTLCGGFHWVVRQRRNTEFIKWAWAWPWLCQRHPIPLS